MTRRSCKIIKTTPMAPADCHTHRHVNYFTLLLNALAIEVEVIVGVTTS